MTADSRGFSLVELLFALLLFGIGAAAAGRVHQVGQTLYRQAEIRGRLHERAQYVLGTLEPDLQMAGYFGPAAPDGILLPAAPATLDACGPGFALQLARPLAVANDGYPLPCGPNGGGAVPDTDVLTIRRASAGLARPERGRVQVRSHPTDAGRRRLQWLGETAATNDGSELRDLAVRSYYVARRADGEAATAGAAPALRVKNLTSIDGVPAFVDTEVMPGVEDLQVEVGYRDAADSLRFAPAAPAGRPACAVRVWLLLRAEETDVGRPPGQEFRYAGKRRQPLDLRHRLLVERTFGLRNAVAP